VGVNIGLLYQVVDNFSYVRKPVLSIALSLVVATAAWARRPGDELKPGFNLFSKQQDIQLGQQAAAQVRKQYHAAPNRELQDYVRRIGERLAAQKEARESGFTFTFIVVNDKSVNAFALPGGPAFVFTGLIQAADNEAQVAGVLGHEMSHVILRHGTNQASKANLMQIPAMLAGALTGSNLLAQLTSLGALPLLLKFSRSDESEADALGTRLMNEAGYNPIEMARFFEKVQAEGASRAPELLSDHPDPGNRVRAVEAEIRALPEARYDASVGDFARQKQLVAQLPAGRSQANVLRAGASSPSPASRPSGGFKQLRGREFALSYPDNWQVFGDKDAATVTIAPRDGIVQGSNGGSSVGYGAIVSYYFPESGTHDIERATEELIHHLHASNPSMGATSGSPRRVSVEDSPGLVTTLASDSPYQGKTETDVLLTVERPEGLFYIIFIAPHPDFKSLQETFDEMVRSIRFSN
jgi:Zn-dependent protease with chaperone function